MHKKRGYNRETPQELLRDYKLFAISCEDSKREPKYFRLFNYISSRIKVDVIEDLVREDEMEEYIHDGKSAPKYVLERAKIYIQKEKLDNEDELWFVMDKDRWSEAQLREIAEFCTGSPNMHVIISNPCFEVWLYFHKKEIKMTEISSCSEFKNKISSFTSGGYHPYKFVPYFREAIANAKKCDSDPHPNCLIPEPNETKMHQLGEALMVMIGKSKFEYFINNILPKLVERGYN
jgi:hypothetical protein